MKNFREGINYLLLDEEELINIDENTREMINKKYVGPKTEEFLIQEKILPFGAHAMMTTYDNKNQKWFKIHNQFVDRNENILKEAEKVFTELNKKVKNVVLIENFGTILLSESCIGCFSSGDFDIIANKEEYDQIKKVMISLGYKEDSRRDVPEYIMNTFYKKSFNNEIFHINFEWLPVARRYIETYEYLKKRVDYFYLNNKKMLKNNIILFDHNALLYMNMLHLSIGHYYNTSPGIRLYVDVDRLVRKFPEVDYELIFKWAKEDKQITRILTVMNLSKQMLNTPFPNVNIKLPKKNIRRSNQIINFLWDKKKQSYVQKDKVLHQFIIDSLSEDSFHITYILRRLFRFNRSKK